MPRTCARSLRRPAAGGQSRPLACIAIRFGWRSVAHGHQCCSETGCRLTGSRMCPNNTKADLHPQGFGLVSERGRRPNGSSVEWVTAAHGREHAVAVTCRQPRYNACGKVAQTLLPIQTTHRPTSAAMPISARLTPQCTRTLHEWLRKAADNGQFTALPSAHG